MVASVQDRNAPLRILHVLRAPIGGLFRHVLDLTLEQIARGHAVGLVADAIVRDARAERILADLEPDLALGLTRIPIRRNPHPSDLQALAHVISRIARAKPDVVHGHGSKGGALARLSGFLPGLPRVVRVYTPHGGSLNHHPGSTLHAGYMGLERLMKRQTDLLVFESGFIASRYGRFVGRPPRLNRVIHNGISAQEFDPVACDPAAADFLYVGELRSAKGIDTLLTALCRATRRLETAPTLALVGSGPDREMLEKQSVALGLQAQVSFKGAMAARDAFRLGRMLVVPSRAESLPYIVLEAAAAAIPIISTNVGGIPEIFGAKRGRLIPADSIEDLANAMIAGWNQDSEERRADAAALSASVRRRFSVEQMVDRTLSAYREALLPRPPYEASRSRQTIAYPS